jgi:hypothetical protein
MIWTLLMLYTGGCMSSYRSNRNMGDERLGAILVSLKWPWLWVTEWLEDRKLRR